MRRFVLLLWLAALPLLASAHEGHHAHGTEAAPLAPAPSGAAVAAPSRCPGGGHEDCCCHEGWCTTPSWSVAVIAAGWRDLPRVLPGLLVAHRDVAALRSAALLRYSPRGPPLLS
jgi:hypothetical protein